MKVDEQEIIESLRQRDAGFARLYAQHAELDRQIHEMESRAHLSPDEEMEIKRLKKLKLRGKDEMNQILKRHRDFQVS
ncbi:MAG: YdcH family protein [Nitrospinota bacterium]